MAEINGSYNKRMSQVNMLCEECCHSMPTFACSCRHPPALICTSCLGSHASKPLGPGKKHMPVLIGEENLEEQKVPQELDYYEQIKKIN